MLLSVATKQSPQNLPKVYGLIFNPKYIPRAFAFQRGALSPNKYGKKSNPSDPDFT